MKADAGAPHEPARETAHVHAEVQESIGRSQDVAPR
jgi:hypothetical protein